MTAILTQPHKSTLEESLWLVKQSRAPRLRTMLKFAEQEIVIPGGPFEGRKFSLQRQPYARHWFAAIDSGAFSRFVATGPTQSGKTLHCSIIPLCYHLFELGESVVFGLPMMDMAGDKWLEDILPVIERSRYKDLLPSSGAGSKGGGKLNAIRFRNGTTLKFMSGGGSDKTRSGFTSRVVIITETDGMDTAGSASREADKITQLENRATAHGSRARIYMECTMSTKQGRTYREIEAGTDSKIVVCCPHCNQWMTPEREHLVGWKDEENPVDAGEKSTFACASCGKTMTNKQRVACNRKAQLLHKGQSIDDTGNVVGDFPRNKTLGFRWNAFHNLFWTPGDIGEREYRASQSDDDENAEKEMCQFVWALPHEPDIFDETPLHSAQIVKRTRKLPKGLLPSDTEYLTIGVDIQKRAGYWAAHAWRPNGSHHVADYGVFEIRTDEMGLESAMLAALRDFRDFCLTGFNWEGHDVFIPNQVWIDAGYQKELIFQFCRESHTPADKWGGRARFRPIIGRGISQQRVGYYSQPTKTGSTVRHLGEQYHISRLPKDRIHLVEINVDYWKSQVHNRLASPPDAPGAITLYDAMPKAHFSLAKHLTAEHLVREFVVGKGQVDRWVTDRRANHWLDAFVYASAAGHFAGARIIKGDNEPKRKRAAPVRPTLKTADGRPFLISERQL